MGLLLYPVFDRDVDLASETSGEFLGHYIIELETFAEQLGLTGLGAFGDSRPVPDDFDGSPDEWDDLMGPCDDWYETAQGAEALHTLTATLRTAECAFENLDVQRAVVDELADLAEQLERASLLGARFRLELS